MTTETMMIGKTCAFPNQSNEVYRDDVLDMIDVQRNQFGCVFPVDGLPKLKSGVAYVSDTELDPSLLNQLERDKRKTGLVFAAIGEKEVILCFDYIGQGKWFIFEMNHSSFVDKRVCYLIAQVAPLHAAA